MSDSGGPADYAHAPRLERARECGSLWRCTRLVGAGPVKELEEWHPPGSDERFRQRDECARKLKLAR